MDTQMVGPRFTFFRYAQKLYRGYFLKGRQNPGPGSEAGGTHNSVRQSFFLKNLAKNRSSALFLVPPHLKTLPPRSSKPFLRTQI